MALSGAHPFDSSRFARPRAGWCFKNELAREGPSPAAVELLARFPSIRSGASTTRMTIRFLIASALITTGLFAQGFGRRAGASNGSNTHTPPTPAQLAAAELTRIARFLKLDSADTSKLTGNATLAGYLETEETTLQTNATTLKTAYAALATDVATNDTKDAATQESTIQTGVNSNFLARVTAAGQVVTALPGAGLSVTLTSDQLTGVAKLLISDRGGFASRR
jgi:hypothetical protein